MLNPGDLVQVNCEMGIFISPYFSNAKLTDLMLVDNQAIGLLLERRRSRVQKMNMYLIAFSTGVGWTTEYFLRLVR